MCGTTLTFNVRHVRLLNRAPARSSWPTLAWLQAEIMPASAKLAQGEVTALVKTAFSPLSAAEVGWQVGVLLVLHTRVLDHFYNVLARLGMCVCKPPNLSRLVAACM
jgi:hypothetical protein